MKKGFFFFSLFFGFRKKLGNAKKHLRINKSLGKGKGRKMSRLGERERERERERKGNGNIGKLKNLPQKVIFYLDLFINDVNFWEIFACDYLQHSEKEKKKKNHV